jgi:hypothetical protein
MHLTRLNDDLRLCNVVSSIMVSSLTSRMLIKCLKTLVNGMSADLLCLGLCVTLFLSSGVAECHARRPSLPVYNAN